MYDDRVENLERRSGYLRQRLDIQRARVPIGEFSKVGLKRSQQHRRRFQELSPRDVGCDLEENVGEFSLQALVDDSDRR